MDTTGWVLVILIVIGLPTMIYGYIKILHNPLDFNKSWVGTTFYVFSHEENVAEMAPIEWLSPKKKNKGRKFYIPESFGRLEPKKTYELFINEEKEFYVKQVAVML